MSKGSTFERKICKDLSLWWTNNKRSDIFWRTAGSGARATTRRKKGKSTANSEGDILAIDNIGQPLIDMTTIELKKGYKWDIKSILDSRQKEPQLIKFFKQSQRESKNRNCNWWLITNQDHKKELLFFNHGFYKILRENNYNMFVFNYIQLFYNEKIYCIKLQDFYDKIDPQIFY